MEESDRSNTNVAIDFTVTDTAGKPWTLSDHLDAAVVMTFHRGDF